MSPSVTILMAVFNGEKYLRESINSILNQTYQDFEFLIIEDGSTDRTPDILESYDDDRIKIVYNNKNLGLIKSLNKGLKLAKGKYIARMDADDISLPYRLQMQVEFMNKNPEIGASSAWLETFGNSKSEVWKTPTDHDSINAKLFSHSCLWHAVSILRRDILDSYNIKYNNNYIRAEDYKLWTDLIKVTKLANIPRVLYRYRSHSDQETNKRSTAQKVKDELVEQFLGRSLEEEEKLFHSCLHFAHRFENTELMKKVTEWVNYLKKQNKIRGEFKEPIFSNTLDEILDKTRKKRFSYSLRNKKRYDPTIISQIISNESKCGFKFRQIIKIILKCLIFYPKK